MSWKHTTFIALALGSGVAQFGCSGGNDGGISASQSQLAGTWRQTKAMGKPVVAGGVQSTFELQPDGNLKQLLALGDKVEVDTGTWSLRGSTLTISLQKAGAVDYTVTSLSGKTMQLNLISIPVEWTKD